MSKKTVNIVCAVASLAMPGLVLAVASDAPTQAPNGRVVIAEPGSSTASSSETESHSYTVQRGDTLDSIARRHGLTFKQLADINGIPTPYRISPGQQLRTQPAVQAMSPASPVATSDSRPTLHSASVADRQTRMPSAPAAFEQVVAQLTSLQTKRTFRAARNDRRGLLPTSTYRKPSKTSEKIKSGKRTLKSKLGADSPFRLSSTYIEKLPDWDDGEMFSRKTELNTDIQLRLHKGLNFTGQFSVPGEDLSNPRLSRAGNSDPWSQGDGTDPFGSSDTDQGSSLADLEKHLIRLNAGGKLGDFGYGTEFLSWRNGYKSLIKRRIKGIKEGKAGHKSWVSWKQGDLKLKTGYSQYWDNLEKDPAKSRNTDRLVSISPSYTLYDWPYVGVSVAYEQGSRESSMDPAGRQPYRGPLSKISTTFDVSADTMNLYFGVASLKSSNDLAESESSEEISYYIGGSYYPFSSLSITPSFDISELTQLNGSYEYRYTSTNSSLSLSYAPSEQPYRVDLYAGYDSYKDSDGYTDAESINTSLSLDWELKSRPNESSMLSFEINSYTYTDNIYSNASSDDLAAEVVWRWTGY